MPPVLPPPPPSQVERVEVPATAPPTPSPAAGCADADSWRRVIETLREHSGDIAHDMKNPLNGVLALSQNVLQVLRGRQYGGGSTGAVRGRYGRYT